MFLPCDALPVLAVGLCTVNKFLYCHIGQQKRENFNFGKFPTSKIATSGHFEKKVYRQISESCPEASPNSWSNNSIALQRQYSELFVQSLVPERSDRADISLGKSTYVKGDRAGITTGDKAVSGLSSIWVSAITSGRNLNVALCLSCPKTTFEDNAHTWPLRLAEAKVTRFFFTSQIS